MKRMIIQIVLLLIVSSSLAFADYKEAMEKGDYQTALSELRPLAEKGDPEAQYIIACMYYTGEGMPQSYAEAAKWCKKAADQGLAKAQYNLGVMYHKGQGVPKDLLEAFKWYRKAAGQGDVQAQTFIKKVDNIAYLFIFIILFWLILSIIIGAVALFKGRSFFVYMILSILFSPLIGLIIIIFKPSLRESVKMEEPQGVGLTEEGTVKIAKHINIKAILLGFLTDICGSMVFGLVLALITIISIKNSAMISQNQIESELVLRLHRPGCLIMSFFIGIGFTILGGFVAGRFAKQSQILHGALVGVLSLLIGASLFIPFSIYYPNQVSSPLWYSVISFLLVVPCGIFGGYISKLSLKKV